MPTTCKRASANPIERLNGAIKLRTDVVESFPNAAALRRLVGANLMDRTEEWIVQRSRHMTLETVAQNCDDLLAIQFCRQAAHLAPRQKR